MEINIINLPLGFMFLKQINRDNDIKRICKERNVKLLSIPYCDRNNLEKILKSFIEEGKDITTKVEIHGQDIPNRLEEEVIY